MHGLVNRAIEEFCRATYGEGVWLAASTAAGADPRGFQIMQQYELRLTGRLMQEIAGRLGKSPRDLAEDVGAWVATVPSIRRLLRFAGTDFAGFMMALPELHGRALMVVRDFHLPRLSVKIDDHGWSVATTSEPIWLHATLGMLHAMADDYGVLALFETDRRLIRVTVPLPDYTPGRPFSIVEDAVPR